MASTILSKSGKKLFEKNMEKYAPTDPMYEFYTDERGKKKRRKRKVPPGLSARDAKILNSVNKRAHYLDKGFSICGFRFGWTVIIGLIPGAGDVANVALGYIFVVRKARQAEIPSWLVHRMLMNNAISGIVGLVPIAGDVFVGTFKANSRNAALLEGYLRLRGEKESVETKPEGGLSPESAAKKDKVTGGNADGKKEVVKGLTKSDPEQVTYKPGTMAPDNPSGNGGAKKKTTRFSFGKKTSSKAADPEPEASKGTKFIENVQGEVGGGSEISGASPSGKSGSGSGGTSKKRTRPWSSTAPPPCSI